MSPAFARLSVLVFLPACVSTHSSFSSGEEKESPKESSRSASSSASVYARAVARRRHGTPRVTRYCLSDGKYSLALDESPASLE